jgi:hypothetical protein
LLLTGYGVRPLPSAGRQSASCLAPAAPAPATPAGTASSPFASAIASPLASPAASPAATPYAIASAEVSATIDAIFRCLAAGDWTTATQQTAPGGTGEQLVRLLEALATDGRLRAEVRQRDVRIRSISGPTATTDVLWTLGAQERNERWTLEHGVEGWRLSSVGPGLPVYEGVIFGLRGALTPAGPSLPHGTLVSPGTLEIVLDVDVAVPPGSLLVVYPRGLCADANSYALTALAVVEREPLTLLLTDLPPTVYRFSLLSPESSKGVEALCAAPSMELTISL